VGPMVVAGVLPFGELVVEQLGVVDQDALELAVELLAVDPVGAFDLAVEARLTGQSQIILWITRGGWQGLLSGFAAGAFEAADGFLVAAHFGGDSFEAAAQLVDLDGETGQGGGVAAAGAVFLDDGAQVGPPVEGGPADSGAGGYFGERDRLPGGGQFGAGGLDPGLLVGVSWHEPG
jgi:hypothetical protein